MIVRIWRTAINAAHGAEYEQFAETRSLPMFRRQRGFLGVLFLRIQTDRAVLTFWKDQQCVADLVHSTSYQETSAQLTATGLLLGQPTVEVFETHGGSLDLPAVAHLLASMDREPA